MQKTDLLINNFNGGEVTAKLDSRSDLQKYASACRVMENFIPYVEGGAQARPGLYFVAEIKDSTKKARLFSFQFSTVQAYIILAEEGSFRFFKDDGQIITAPNTPYEIASPYAEDDLPLIKTTQSADILYMAHRGYVIKKLSRTGHTAWTVTDFAGAPFAGAGNYPGAIAFFEQRFMAGGTINNPLDIWGSVSADFEDFTEDPADDSAAIHYSLMSDKVDAVNWMIGEEYLMIGTAGGVWRLGASTTNDPLTGSNVVAKRQLANGVKDMDAEMVNDAILYVQRGGTTVRKATWVWEKDKYDAMDVTRIAKHITKGATAVESGIVDMDYQSEPFSILWSVRADGTLLGMVYEPNENIYPWFRVTTDGEFESVATITAEGEEDQVWVIVKRTIGGVTKRYVEYFKPQDYFAVYKDAFFVDSGLTWEGDAAIEVTAISQAAQCVVTTTNALADGNKVKFYNTGTWLDNNICVVSDRAAGSFKIKDLTGTSYINSTAFPAYPPTTGSGTVKQVAMTLSGLSHLEGKSVAILTDQGKHPARTVASGAITLFYYANKVTVGLPYNYNLQPMKFEAGTAEGTSRGRKKKIYALSAAFYQSAGVKWGPNADNLRDVPFGTGDQPTLFTGDKETDFDADYETGASVYIQGSSPLPCTVLSIAPKMVMTDG